METNENAAASGNNGRESIIQKLDNINGIGRPTAEAFYEIGLHSYIDLIQFLDQHTKKEIAAELASHNARLPLGFVKKDEWINHARELSQLEKTSLVEHDAQFIISFDIERDRGGKPILRTIVYDEKNSGMEVVFDGNETAPWVNWIIKQIDLPLPVEPIVAQGEVVPEPQTTHEEAAAPALTPTPGKALDARLEISSFHVSVVEPLAEIPKKRLAAEVGFQLSGMDAEEMTAQSVPFRIEIFTVDLARGILNRVVSREGQLEPGQFEYTEQLEFAIPDVGRYGYYGLVRLLPLGDFLDYLPGPIMNVNA